MEPRALQAVDEALSAGEYERARELAPEPEDLPILDHLRLTILAAQDHPQDFNELSTWWIGRAIHNRVVDYHDLHWLIPELHAVGERRNDGVILLEEVRLRVGRRAS